MWWPRWIFKVGQTVRHKELGWTAEVVKITGDGKHARLHLKQPNAGPYSYLARDFEVFQNEK